MSYLVENLKVLIWRSKGELSQKSYSEHIDMIAARCGIASEHLRSILRDKERASNQELASLRIVFSDYSDNLSAIEYAFLFSDLIDNSRDNILRKNLNYLFGTLEHGENAEFVKEIGVNPSTLTRWKQGKTRPDKYALSQIARYFGFKDVNELSRQLLFLDLDPVSTQQKKKLCKKLIDEMDKDDFEMVFYALQKILD